MFVGRYQPLHEGHEWLIRQKLDKGVPCLIAVRDTPQDASNPYPTDEVVRRIEEHFEGEDVRVIVIPDIESINYGRGVGYEINEHVPPPDIHRISATDIRRKGET